MPEQIQIDKTDGGSVLHNRFTLVLINFYGSLPRMDIKKNGFNLSLGLEFYYLFGLLLSKSVERGRRGEACIRNSKLCQSDLLIFG